MTANDATELLARTAPFSELDIELHQPILQALEARILEAGDSIGPFSPPGRDGLYLIEQGEVALFDNQDELLEKRGPGELFGHAITIEGRQPEYRVDCTQVTRVWQLPQVELDRLCQSQPLIAAFIAGTPGERLRSVLAVPRERLDELSLKPAITVTADTAINRAAEVMTEHRVSCLPVMDQGHLAGILTDRDLRSRVLAAGRDPARPVAEIMTPDPVSAPLDARIDSALMTMMRLGVHHLPVLAADRALVGVVSAGDLLRLQTPHPLRLVRDIQRAGDPEALINLAHQGPGILARLVDHGSEVTEVGRMASTLTDACTRRLIELALAELGPAPMAWCWTAFGSQARMEQGLISDQDNGLILAEDPDAEAARYFRQLADRVCDGLNACGYVYCPGGVMAKGDWRMSWQAWRRTFNGWMVEPEPKAVMQSSIFFDLRPIAGDHALAETLHAEVLEQARQSRLFRRFLAAESLHNRPALGLFGQFSSETGDSGRHGLNLKKRGVIPVVDLARVRALEGAIAAVHTEERITAAAEAEVMNPSDADDLIHALRFIGNIRLRHQVRLHQAGETPDHLVDPDALSGLHRRYLRSAFGIIKTAQKALEQRYVIG